MQTPLVSVLMTAYNRQDYISEAIESVLTSGYEDFELIIVDDHSQDETVKVVQKYQSKDARIRLYVNKRNLGDYPNRNHAATYARGKYLKYLDSDDKLYSGGLEYCVNRMEANPGACWAILYPVPIDTEYLMDTKQSIHHHFFTQPFLKAGPGGTIIRKDFFMKLGGYPVSYGPANDMYFNLQAASSGNTLLLKDIFLFYRRHTLQEQSNTYSYLYNNCRYLKDALEDLNLPLTPQQTAWLQKKRKRRFALNITKYFLQTFNWKKTRYAACQARFSLADLFAGIFHRSPKPEIWTLPLKCCESIGN